MRLPGKVILYRVIDYLEVAAAVLLMLFVVFAPIAALLLMGGM